MKDYHVKIEMTGGCSRGMKELAKNIAEFLKKEVGFKAIDVEVLKNSYPYDGFVNDESVLISVK
jgi:hypothetical protein